MKKAMFAVVVLGVFAVVGCAAETAPTEEATSDEGEALTATQGYCDVDVSTGLLNGKCRSNAGTSGMCCVKSSTVCPAGAAPGALKSAYSAICGTTEFDYSRRCTNYC